MKRPFLIFSIIIFVAVVVLVGYIDLTRPARSGIVSVSTDSTENAANTDNSGIQVSSPSQNQLVSSPFDISGSVNGNGWSGFEGQVGSVKLQDENGTELASGPLTATTDWTQLPTQFKTTLTFDPGTATSGRLVLSNENTSGDPSNDHILIINVKFK